MNLPVTNSHLFLRGVEENPQPSPYADAIAHANSAGIEYWGIWNLLAFRPQTAHHLAALSHEIMFADAPISSALRELIAAYTSSLNNCEFCMHAHAAVAAHTLGEELVWSVLRDLERSALEQKQKALLRFTRKLTLDSGSITETDIAGLHVAGWEDDAIFYAIEACALFNFYNRYVSGSGVRLVSDESVKRLATRMATNGYNR
jgi:uncharacterized peroxidase-related enzyme